MSGGGDRDDAPPGAPSAVPGPLSTPAEATVDPFERTKEAMSPAPSKMDGVGSEDTDVRDVGPWLDAILGEGEGDGGQDQAPPKAPTGSSTPGRTCPRCGFVGASDARFCVQCGADMTIRAAGGVSPSAADPPHGPNEARTLSTVGRCPDCAASLSAPTSACPGCDRPLGGPLVLISVTPEGTDGDALAPVLGEAIIGRAPDAHLSFSDDAHMSPEHAQVRVGPDGVSVEDRDSLNGTFIRIKGPTQVRSGDTFAVGRQILRLETTPRATESGSLAADGTRVLGSPAPAGSCILVQLAATGGVQDRYHLPDGGAYIGRDSGDVRFPTDHYMSGTHAELAMEKGRGILRDLESSNGTWVRIRKATPLVEGDEIYVGSQVVRVAPPTGRA